MAGLAHDAAHFFKFLFILILYSLAMTLFVSPLLHTISPHSNTQLPPEFPLGDSLPEWRHCDTPLCSLCSLSDDFCWLFCAPQRHTPRSSLAAVDLSLKIHPRGFISQRGRLWIDDRRYPSGCARRHIGKSNYEFGMSSTSFEWIEFRLLYSFSDLGRTIIIGMFSFFLGLLRDSAWGLLGLCGSMLGNGGDFMLLRFATHRYPVCRPNVVSSLVHSSHF